MDGKITKGDQIKDSVGRWATVLAVKGNTLIVDRFWRFVHIDNVQAVR